MSIKKITILLTKVKAVCTVYAVAERCTIVSNRFCETIRLKRYIMDLTKPHHPMDYRWEKIGSDIGQNPEL